MIQNLNIKDRFISENIDVFEGNGTFKKKCAIEIDKKCTPVASPPRRIPYTIRKKLKDSRKDGRKRDNIESRKS